jgi:hypothetical protein
MRIGAWKVWGATTASSESDIATNAIPCCFHKRVIKDVITH